MGVSPPGVISKQVREGPMSCGDERDYMDGERARVTLEMDLIQ